MRHRDQIDRLRDAGAVAESLEDRERFLVMRETGLRLLEVDVPVADAIEAARHERLVAERAGCAQGLAAVLAGAGVVARRPQLA